MNLKCVAEHTVDLDRLTRQSKVLDLGCRAFTWSKAMLEYVDKVYCVDADPYIHSPDNARLPLIHGAVMPWDQKVVLLSQAGNGTGNRVYADADIQPKGQYVHVNTISLKHILTWATRPREEVLKMLKTMNNPPAQHFDLIKFDIEGSEIPVLNALEEPPADQLSIEFHMHTGTPKYLIEDCYKHLESIGYIKVFEDFSSKHGCGMNVWDSLFILPIEIKDAKLTEVSLLPDGTYGSGYIIK